MVSALLGPRTGKRVWDALGYSAGQETPLRQLANILHSNR
jgi:hypothetical protein